MIKIYEQHFGLAGKETIYADTNTTDIIYKKRKFFGILRLNIHFWKNINDAVEIRFFGKKINKFGQFKDGKIKLTFFGKFSIRLSKKYSCEKLYYILEKYVDYKMKNEEYTGIIINNATGEPFLYLSFLHYYIDKNNLKNVVILSRNGQHNEIIRMYNYHLINVHNVFFNLTFKLFKLEDHRKIIDLFETQYFVDYEKHLISGKQRHFYDSLKMKLGCTNAKSVLPVISKNKKYATLLQLSRIDKDLLDFKNNKVILKKPIVFILPDSNSNGKLSNEMLYNLSSSLQQFGFCVLINGSRKELSSWNNFVWFSHSEARFLGDIASYVIGIRSGLFDILSSTKSKKFVIYKHFCGRASWFPESLDAQIVKSAFSLKELPFVDPNDVFEYNGENQDMQYIYEDIIMHIKKDKVENKEQVVFEG